MTSDNSNIATPVDATVVDEQVKQPIINKPAPRKKPIVNKSSSSKKTALDKPAISEKTNSDKSISSKNSTENKQTVRKKMTASKSEEVDDAKEISDSIVQKTYIEPNATIELGVGITSAELPESLRGEYTVTNQLSDSSNAEGKTYLCYSEDKKKKVVIKVYSRGRTVNAKLLEKLKAASQQDSKKYLKILPQLYDFSDNYEIWEYIDD